MIPDEFRQVGALDDFHDDVKVTLFDEGLVELDDVGVFELFVDLDLSELLVDLLTGHLGDLQALQGVLVVALFGQVHAAKCPLADFFDEAVTAHHL